MKDVEVAVLRFRKAPRALGTLGMLGMRWLGVRRMP
jgi:hypothetical protein